MSEAERPGAGPVEGGAAAPDAPEPGAPPVDVPAQGASEGASTPTAPSEPTPVADGAQAPAAPSAEAPAPSLPRIQALKARVVEKLPLLGFFAGFVWDSATLSRVDKLSDNLILLAYLMALGGLLLLSHRVREQPTLWPRVSPRLEWVDWLVQFFFGGLYSAYVVFYFKSATFGRSFLFLAALSGLMVLNEFFAERLGLDRLRVPFFALCVFSFLLFFVPVMTGYLGAGIFTLSLLLAFGAAMGLAWGMERGLSADLPDRMVKHAKGVSVVLGTMLALDFFGVIPPVPFALMSRGIFHEVKRTAEGYELSWEPTWRFWRKDDSTFYYRDGDDVWCFTAIFAPTGTALSVEHVWEWWDPDQGEWVERSRIPLSMKGGRDGGFRTYSKKTKVALGEWRVRVVSESGRELGRIDLDIVEGDKEAPALERRLAL